MERARPTSPICAATGSPAARVKPTTSPQIYNRGVSGGVSACGSSWERAFSRGVRLVALRRQGNGGRLERKARHGETGSASLYQLEHINRPARSHRSIVLTFRLFALLIRLAKSETRTIQRRHARVSSVWQSAGRREYDFASWITSHEKRKPLYRSLRANAPWPSAACQKNGSRWHVLACAFAPNASGRPFRDREDCILYATM